MPRQNDSCPRLTRRCLICCFCLIILSVKPAAPAAYELRLTPDLRERLTWNDNFFFKNVEDFELRSEPKLSLDYRSERNQLSASGDLADFRYLDKSEYDRANYAADLVWRGQLSERLNASLQGGWLRDYSLDSFWDDDSSAYVTMLRRKNYNAGTTLSYELTELDSVDLSFNWSKLVYEKRVSGYSDYDMLGGNVTWRHSLLDGRMSLVALGSWQHVEFDSPPQGRGPLAGKQDITQNSFNALAGIYWSPLEKLVLQIMAGANYTESEVENAGLLVNWGLQPQKRNSHSTGLTGSFDLTWKEENSAVKLSYKQEQLPSAYGELRTVNTVMLSGSYDFNRRTGVYSSLRYSNSKSDNVTGREISKDFWIYNLQGRYLFTPELSGILQYSHMYYYNKSDDARERSNAVFLQFAYTLPLTLQ